MGPSSSCNKSRQELNLDNLIDYLIIHTQTGCLLFIPSPSKNVENVNCLIN